MKHAIIVLFLTSIILFSGSVLAQDAANDSATITNTTAAATAITVPVPSTMPSSSNMSVCTADAKQCPDGSYVTRNPGANCEFYPCPVYANTTPSQTVPANTTAGLPTQIPAPVVKLVPTQDWDNSAACRMVESLFREYNELMNRLAAANNESDNTTASYATSKIIGLKQEISNYRDKCNSVGSGQTTPATAKAGATSSHSVPTVSCGEVSQWESKYAFYKGLYAMSDDALKNKGYSSRDEVLSILNELNTNIERIKASCTGKTVSSGVSGTGEMHAAANISVPSAIMADSGASISNYYKSAIEKITSSGSIDSQISSLKELRKNIDSMIENLIKSRDSLSTTEVSGVVDEINVTPGAITADNVRVNTIGKQVTIDVNNSLLAIEPSEENVIIRDKDLNVSTSGVSIVNGTLTVGNAAVKMAASDVLNKIRMKAKSVALENMNDTAVYKIKAAENRKLLGLFATEVEKDVTADAGNGTVMVEVAPWWSFLTTG